MFTFKVIPDGGEPYEVAAKSRHIVEWEGRFKRSLKAVQESMSMTALTELAYVASSAQGLGPSQDWATFKASCDIDLTSDEDDDADPTRPDR